MFDVTAILVDTYFGSLLQVANDTTYFWYVFVKFMDTFLYLTFNLIKGRTLIFVVNIIF